MKLQDLAPLGDALVMRYSRGSTTVREWASLVPPLMLNSFLRRKCQWAIEVVELDATTPTTFDSMYSKNLEKHKGLLLANHFHYSESRTSPIAKALATEPMFYLQQFAVSMVISHTAKSS